MQEIIRAEKLCKTYGSGSSKQTVLQDVDVSIYEGEFTVIMGASGAGKSTLLNALSGIDTISGGKVFFGEKNISTFSANQAATFRRRNCGFVFQHNFLVESLTALDNVLAPALNIMPLKKALERAKHLFELVGIAPEMQRKFPSQLSGGEAQRVALARALVNSPWVLFADEPTGALNSQIGYMVLDTLTRFNSEGQTIVMVTHDVHSALRAHRVLYLKDGNILGECKLGAYTEDDAERSQMLTDFLAEMGW